MLDLTYDEDDNLQVVEFYNPSSSSAMQPVFTKVLRKELKMKFGLKELRCTAITFAN